MALLNKDQILKAKDLKTEEVSVPEWGGEVLVRGLTGQGRDSFEMKIGLARKSGKTIDDFRSSLVARCLVDEEGERLFTDKEVEQLGRKSGAALDRVANVIKELSGMNEGDTKEAAEDFGEAAGDDSPSA